jgi:hypothetical protein
VIAIHTDAPLIPLTQMIQGDAAIEIGGELGHVVLADDDMLGVIIGFTLDALGYETRIQQGSPVGH